MADPLAGALLAGAGWRDTGKVLLLMVAAACFYAGGTALNDWHDWKRDLVERPGRPIPSGRISRWRALLGAVVFLALGQLLTSTLEPAVGAISLLLLVCIVLYDVLMKDIPAAPALMGAARGFNLMMGLSLLTAEPGTPYFYPVIALAIYVTGLTIFARREAGPSRKEQLLVGAGFMAVGLAMQAMLILFFIGRVVSATGMIWVLLLAGAVGYTCVQAIVTPAPVRIQRTVKTAVLGIVLFEAALVAFCCGLPLSLLVVALLVPAVWLGRWMYST